jgi:PAS domain-containing protein
MSAPKAGGSAPLVTYRFHGGAASVDQRLTVFADGLVELDERHRRRGTTRLTIEERDLEQLRSALAQIPDARWSLGPTLAMTRAKLAFRELLRLGHAPDLGRSFFQLRSGRQSIAGETQSVTEADAARALLDNMRVHAVRQAEEENPTGGPA